MFIADIKNIALTVVVLLSNGSAFAQFNFEDRTPASNIVFEGESYGSSWGDVNSDGLPDIYVSHHREAPSMYVNNGDGTFTDTANNVLYWSQYPYLDQHGAAWGDFNKDGAQDLWQSLGAADDNQFMVNHGDLLVNEVVNYGLEYRSWPGRLPIWLDANRDGHLDGTVMNRGRALMLTYDGTGFSDASDLLDARCKNNQWAHLADLNGDNIEELICAGQATWPERIYDLSTSPWTQTTGLLPSVAAVTDSVTGDFNGDHKLDFYVLRGTLRPSDAAITTTKQVQAHIVTHGSREETINFESTGIITVHLAWSKRNVTNMRIGSDGENPSGFNGSQPIVFTLDPADPKTWGMESHDPAVNNGVYMGYNTGTNTWTFSLSPGGSWNYTYWTLDSTQNVSNIVLSGPGGAENGLPPSLLLSGPGGYSDQAAAKGLGSTINCAGAAVADFDNDMDEDIYVVCRDGVTNLANRLYENLGNGSFVEVPNAGGAQGPVGYNKGRGESATVGDYDLNGFVDLYITNGLNLFPEPPVSLGGKDLLFGNIGNANSWIELDLLGTVSNAPAVGAKVYATAGGKTQFREQNGGYHRWSQDHQRLHFGLATNSQVDLQVVWPNGLTETYNDVPANKIYRITEGEGYAEVVAGAGVRTVNINNLSVSEAGGNANFDVSLTGSGTENVMVSYSTLNDSAVSPDDYLSTVGNLLFTPGQSSKNISVPINEDILQEGAETFRVMLSGATNAVPAKYIGIATIVDNDVAACGKPSYSSGTEVGVFLWEDCGSGNWHLRSTAGGIFSDNSGLVTSLAKLVGVSPFSVEGHDRFIVSDPKVVDWGFKAWSISEDGFDFSVAPGAATCVALAAGSSVSAIQVGHNKLPVSGEFELTTLGPCSDQCH